MGRPPLAVSILIGATMAAAPTVVQAQPAAPSNDLAVSSAINQELPDWVRLGGEYRARFEGYTGGKFTEANDERYLLNRLRLNLTVRPSEWFRLVFQAQDSRILGALKAPHAPPYQDTIDLRLGYVEFGRGEEAPVSVAIGRQDLNFGEKRLIGDADWRNVPNSFDAVRVIFRRREYRVDAFLASAVVPRDGAFDRSALDSTIHGVYSTFPVSWWKSKFDAYVLYRIASAQRTETGRLGRLHSETLGFRWTGTLPALVEFGSEVAFQTGATGPEQLRAWAGHWILRRPLPGFPRIKAVAEYNYASGDRDPADGRRGAFDQLYAANHDKYGMADLIGWRNLHHARTAGEVRIASRWTAVCAYNSFWLASARDGLYTAGGTLAYRAADGSAGRHIGTEADLQALWSMSSYAQFGVGFARVFPGEFLRKTTPGASYNSPFITITTAF